MQPRSDWYHRISTEIEQHRLSLNQKEVKKYKLDLLLRVAARVDEFSGYCGECQAFRQEITGLVQELSLMAQMLGKENQKHYSKTIDGMVTHLQKVHELVRKGQYLGVGVGIGWAVGAGLGAALGSALDNPGIGAVIGIVLGIAVGRYLDKKAEKEGKVL